MNKLPENIGSTNPPPSPIPYDNYSLTGSSVSVSRWYMHMKNSIKWVWRNPIYPQFVQNKNPHHNTNNTQHQIIPPGGNTINEPKYQYFKDKKMGKHSVIHHNYSYPCPYIHPCFQVMSIPSYTSIYNIGWFTWRKQIRFVVTLYGYFIQNPTPRTISLKWNIGPHRHHKILKIYE